MQGASFMSGHAMFRCGLVLAGFLLGASSVAEAKIPQSRQALFAPGRAYANTLIENLGGSISGPCQGNSVVTKTVTLNFGPLHYQEVLTDTPKTCRS
jgi:hypothetical protein